MVASADTMSPRCLSGVIIRPPANKHHGEVTGHRSLEMTFLHMSPLFWHRGVRGVLPGWPAAPKFFVVVLPMAKKKACHRYELCANIGSAWCLTVGWIAYFNIDGMAVAAGFEPRTWVCGGNCDLDYHYATGVM